MKNKELYAHASAFARVYACPASLGIEADCPNISTESSEHGERLHGIMEHGLNREIVQELILSWIRLL